MGEDRGGRLPDPGPSTGRSEVSDGTGPPNNWGPQIVRTYRLVCPMARSLSQQAAARPCHSAPLPVRHCVHVLPLLLDSSAVYLTVRDTNSSLDVCALE